METSKLLNGYEFKAGEPERAARYQLFEPPYGHLVQAPGDLAELRRPIPLKGGAPTEKSPFAEY